MNKQGTLDCRQCRQRYAILRSVLETFDIINCEHKDWWWRLIGHTAMVYRDNATGQIFVYESTSLNKFTGISGVQLTPMRIWLKYYPGKVFVRRVLFEEPKYFRFTAHIKLQGHIEKYRGTPYPDMNDPEQRQFVINAALDLPAGIGLNPDRHDIMFCTQLVVDAWQEAGLYKGDWPPSEWQPDDMRQGGRFERRLVKGVSLGKELRLK